MSSTRYAATAEASEAAPERFLASAKLRGIAIGLNIITRVGMIRTDRERAAMIWLYNYARLRNLTADALSDELDLSKPDIRTVLTDPDAEAALLGRFVRQVEALRQTFEASLPEMYPTKPAKILWEALALAKKRPCMVEVVGITRIGKSIPGFNWYQRNAMDCGLFMTCPDDEAERTFLFENARMLGIGTTGGKKVGQVRPQVRACYGRKGIRLLIVDEAHFLWPIDKRSKPKRIEFLRGLYDMYIPAEVSIVILASPQHTMNMNLALDEHNRWAPGQWDGRVIRYHLPDNKYDGKGEIVKYAMSDGDLRGVAKLHAPDFNEGMIEALVLNAKSTSGFCGAMVNAIELARFKAELRGLPKVTPDILLEAQSQMAAGTKILHIAGKAQQGRRAA